ncbi:MAG: IPTL-CTERM sorting domain-containing protein [Planctomycetes bacterium]|nr:IPTL-CTERM sorting domain-containing protein [Planctomycetota bacterium]
MFIDQVVIHTICEAIVHEVPLLTQAEQADCGPTAAASCVKWFQGNGYPGIKTRGGSSELGEYKKQLKKDAKTNRRGTGIHRLKDAMNKLVDEGPNQQAGAHKRQVRAKLPATSGYNRNFDYLDSEFVKGEDLVLIIKFGNNFADGHYVTVRSIRRSGGTGRVIEFMDPATGQFVEATVTIGVDNQGRPTLVLTYRGGPARIGGIIAMSPDNFTDSTMESTPEGHTKITYTAYFPATKKMKDLHILVKDCDPNNWSVNEALLPSGWKWKLEIRAGECWLSIYSDGSKTDMISGSDIVVTYKGSKKVRKYRKKIHQTTSGTDSPIGSIASIDAGYTVVEANAEPPDRPRRPRAAILDSPSGRVVVALAWEPSVDPTVVQYETYDRDSGQLLALSSEPFVTLELEADVLYTVVVAARNSEDLLSEDSEPVSVLCDEAFAPGLEVGEAQDIVYMTPMTSWHEDFAWMLTVPGAELPGTLVVTAIDGETEPIIQDAPGRMHRPFYHLASNAELLAGTIAIAIPYDDLEVVGSEAELRLYQLQRNNWTDVTTGVDPELDVIFGTLQGFGAIAIVNGTETIPTVSEWGLIIMTLLLLTGLKIKLGRRRAAQA